MESNASNLPPTFVPEFHDPEAVRRMQYRDLAGTNMVTSVLGLGGSALGMVYDQAPKSEEERMSVVIEALKRGVNVIDTAPWYGQGESERILGLALQRVPRRAYYINTKVGRYEKDPPKMFDFSAKKVLESVSRSLDLLNVDYLDIVQVHDVEFAPSLDIILEETLPALFQLQKQGKLRYIGITGYPLDTLHELLERSLSTSSASLECSVNTVLSYCHLTALDQSLLTSKLMALALERGVGIISAAPVAMGLLSDRTPPSWHPASELVKASCQKAVKKVKDTFGLSLAELSLKMSMNCQNIATTLVSMITVEELLRNIDAVTELSEIERAALKEAEDIFLADLGSNRSWEGVEVQKYWDAIRQSTEV